MSQLIGCMGAEFLRECFDADFENGKLIWRNRPLHHFDSKKRMMWWNSKHAGNTAGAPGNQGYLKVWVTFCGKRYGLLVHRVLWCMKFGKWPYQTIDHIDMNRANNRLENLREASYEQQSANRKGMGAYLKGVTFDKATKRFVAQITISGKNKFIGRFNTEIEAHQAYMDVAIKIHGEFARAS